MTHIKDAAMIVDVTMPPRPHVLSCQESRKNIRIDRVKPTGAGAILGEPGDANRRCITLKVCNL
jgi:hypothetical protein